MDYWKNNSQYKVASVKDLLILILANEKDLLLTFLG